MRRCRASAERAASQEDEAAEVRDYGSVFTCHQCDDTTRRQALTDDSGEMVGADKLSDATVQGGDAVIRVGCEQPRGDGIWDGVVGLVVPALVWIEVIVASAMGR